MANLRFKDDPPTSVYDFMKDAHEAGVEFYWWSSDLDSLKATKADAFTEWSRFGGGAHAIEFKSWRMTTFRSSPN